MSDLLPSISRFFHRWQSLEASLAENVPVLDFDFCPREHITELEPPFADRLEALRHLEQLRQQLADAPPETLCNHAFLSQKLTASATFIRALMGERFPFARYLKATMGIDPWITPRSEIDELRQRIEERFGALGLPFSVEGRLAFEDRMVMRDLSEFETELRSEASLWVSRLQQRIGLTTDPCYEIEVANEDAYWANWIDGVLDRNIRLRVNIHPRVIYLKGSTTGFAVHEIGGHALQALELDAARREGQVDSAALNLVVHSCEQFQLEGLAQTVMELMAEEGEIPEALHIDLLLRAYHGALINNAHLEIEAGRPVDEVAIGLLHDAPFAAPVKILSDLRDRSRHPLFRCYIHVYAPSRRKFLEALELPREKRILFLREMYTRLWTPDQIDAKLQTLRAQA